MRTKLTLCALLARAISAEKENNLGIAEITDMVISAAKEYQTTPPQFKAEIKLEILTLINPHGIIADFLENNTIKISTTTGETILIP